MCNVNTYNFYDFLRSKPCFHLLPPNVPLIRYTFIFSISKFVCIAKLYFKQFIILYVQCHFQSSPSPHKCSPNLSILILDLTVSMININISTKIFSAMSPKLSCLVIPFHKIIILQVEIERYGGKMSFHMHKKSW